MEKNLTSYLVRLNLRDVFCEEPVPLEDVVRVEAGEDEVLLDEVHQHLAHHLAHVHARDHLLENLSKVSEFV